MNRWLKTFIQLIVSVGLALLVLYFVFNKVDWAEFYQQSRQVDYFWVVLSMLLGFFSYLLRAYRWQIMFYPTGHTPALFRTFLAVMSGYLANLLVPRLGEVTRCGVLKKSEHIPISISFGTVITERLMDVLTLGLLLVFTLFIEYDKISDFLATTLETDLNWQMILPLGLVALGIGAWLFFRFIYPSQTKVGAFSRGVIEGLVALRKVNIPRFLVSTLGIWLVYYLMTYMVVFALPATAHLPWQVGFSMLVAGVVAFVLPVQSGFGTFHALVSTMLMAYQIDATSALFLATLIHTSQLLAVLAYGLISGILAVFISPKTDDKA